MEYKLIAFDLDGTLLKENKEISKRAEEAIKEALNQGLIVTTSTGRSLTGVKNYPLIMNLPYPLIIYNGAVILDNKTGKFLFEHNLDLEDAKKIYKLGLQLGASMCMWSHNNMYVNKINEQVKYLSKYSGEPPIVVSEEEADELFKQGITKFIWADTEEKIESYFQEVDKLNDFNKVSYCPSQTIFLEFYHSDVSKGEGVKKLCEMYNIDLDEVITIGDGWNDMSMIKVAGLGVAMGNGRDFVKDMADYVADTNDNDGVAKVIEKFILNKNN